MYKRQVIDDFYAMHGLYPGYVKMYELAAEDVYKRQMAKPEILPTDTWLGIIKKKTADATMIVAKVITKNSLSVSHSFILSPPEYYIVTARPVFLQALSVMVS